MEKITLAHGSGGTAMHNLIGSLFLKELDNDILRRKQDSAIIKIDGKSIAFTTDSYVVDPIFFPGGDIGSLAVCGTINDLSVCGARPLYLSLGLVIEEGLDRQALKRITCSISCAARKAGVKVVTGDTKVVGKGSCDRIFINTSGIGEVYYDLSIDKITHGDAVIVSGALGEHAVSVLSKREGISFKSSIKSDVAALNGVIRKTLRSSPAVKFMRDPTRGGLGTTLNEIVDGRKFGISINEEYIPVKDGVKSACEILGMDPLYLSCEGRFVAIVAQKDAGRILSAIKKDPQGRGARVVGQITREYKGMVCMNTASGGKRIVPMLSGEQLPRIC